MVLIRFWSSLTKKDSVKSAMKYNFCFYFYPSVRTFFSRIQIFSHGSRFFRIRSEFLADPDPDSEKKSDPDPGEKNRIRNTE